MKKEESMREFLGFYINQVDVKKYQKKKSNNKTLEQKLVEGFHFDEEDEIVQDDFLNQNEFAEIKGNYDDYGFGDLTIVFPNPDHEDTVDIAVDFKEAENTFDNSLTVLSDEGVSKAQMLKERDSFLLAYLSLNKFTEKINQKHPDHKPTRPKEKKFTHHHRDNNDQTSYQKYVKIMEDLNQHQKDSSEQRIKS